MSKRGVSPVVATVLLITLVVILGTIIFIWAKGFLSESAIKGDRVVENSCDDVKFEVQIIGEASECPKPNSPTDYYSAIDINNLGNIPIYGVKVLRYDDSTDSIDSLSLSDQPFTGGTVKIGQSSFVCLDFNVNSGDQFRVIPKLLAEKDKRKIVYTCPEKDGITVAYVD